jgi:hypothetical protein
VELNQKLEYSIQLVDDYGNKVHKSIQGSTSSILKSNKFTISLQDWKTKDYLKDKDFSVDEINNEDGTYHFTLIPKKQGIFQLSMKLGSKILEQCTLLIQVIEGYIDPSTTTLVTHSLPQSIGTLQR